MLGNDADALDATQDALVAALRALGRFDGRSSFGTWIHRIATNVCIDELRRRRRRPVTGFASDIADAAAADELSHGPSGSFSRSPRAGGGVDPADEVAARMDIDAALASLPVEFRTAVVLRDVCDLPYDEIAVIVAVPVGTVRSRIARARSALAATWQTGDSDSDSGADGDADSDAEGAPGNESRRPDVKAEEGGSPVPSQEEERTS